MDQPKDETKEKKVYQKPLLTKVELIAEEAVLSVCKTTGGKAACEFISQGCISSPGS